MRLEPANHSADSDGLQTDVMRFMAIIAFCLIAVLALVRNADPLAGQPPPLPAEHPAKMLDAQSPPAPAADPPPVHMPLRPQPQARPETQIEMHPPLEIAASDARDGSEPAERPGLALRFASDRDFLRLVETGRVRVFAFRPDQPGTAAFGLGRNLEFVSSQPPGRIYELEADTIPPRVIASLARATGSPGSFSWGVRMPAGLEASIRSWIDRDVDGELIIDRYAEVRHVGG